MMNNLSIFLNIPLAKVQTKALLKNELPPSLRHKIPSWRKQRQTLKPAALLSAKNLQYFENQEDNVIKATEQTNDSCSPVPDLLLIL